MSLQSDNKKRSRRLTAVKAKLITSASAAPFETLTRLVAKIEELKQSVTERLAAGISIAGSHRNNKICDAIGEAQAELGILERVFDKYYIRQAREVHFNKLLEAEFDNPTEESQYVRIMEARKDMLYRMMAEIKGEQNGSVPMSPMSEEDQELVYHIEALISFVNDELETANLPIENELVTQSQDAFNSNTSNEQESPATGTQNSEFAVVPSSAEGDYVAVNENSDAPAQPGQDFYTEDVISGEPK